MAQIFCDFDGTITSQDSIIFLTERFGAGPEYRANTRKAIKEGTLTVYEGIRQQLASVSLSWKNAARALKTNISVDPTFSGFVHWCDESDHSLVVVSAGMIPVLDLFIGDVGVHYLANPVEISSDGWHYQRDESIDKGKLLSAAQKRGLTVHIGDGTSDVFAIPYTDLLFAKTGSYLAAHCKENAVPAFLFEDFVDVRKTLELELRSPERA